MRHLLLITMFYSSLPGPLVMTGSDSPELALLSLSFRFVPGPELIRSVLSLNPEPCRLVVGASVLTIGDSVVASVVGVVIEEFFFELFLEFELFEFELFEFFELER